MIRLPSQATAVSGISRINCILVAVGCGWVVVASPSEIGRLGIGLALGPTLATIMLAAISSTSFAAGLLPTRYSTVQIWCFRIAGFLLGSYGIYAWWTKGSVALPTAALAVAKGLRYFEISGELRSLIALVRRVLR